MARNVVLFVLDSARKDVFDAAVSRLSDRADVSFEQCRAASSWSTPSHASMFTGTLPSEHGVHAHNRYFTDIDRSETFLGSMPDHEALGISANIFASSTYDFDAWFDEFVEVSTGKRFTEGIDPNAFYVESEATGIRRHAAFVRAALGSDHPLYSLANGTLATLNVLSRDAPIPKLLDDGVSTVVRTSKRLTDRASEPYFLFTNIEDTHMPHRPVWGFDRDSYDAPADWSSDDVDEWDVMADPEAHEQYFEWFRQLYAANTSYVDRKLDALVTYLQRHSDNETTFVVTGDHGENLGSAADEGLLGHKSSLSEGVLHVPLLLINPPEGYERRETDYFSHLDLVTLLPALARGETPEVFRERVPAELIGMSPGPDPPTEYDYWDRAIRCTYEGERKWVWDSMDDRRRLEIDHERPGWQSTVAEDVTIPEWALALFDEEITAYKRRASARSESVAVDAATQQRLEDLGYK